MATFLSISPNLTKFLTYVCLVPAGLFCHSCFNLCSLFKKVINLYTFRLLRLLKGQRHQIFKLQNLRVNQLVFVPAVLGEKFPTAEFWRYRQKLLAGKKKENSQNFNKDFYLSLYLPLCLQSFAILSASLSLVTVDSWGRKLPEIPVEEGVWMWGKTIV